MYFESELCPSSQSTVIARTAVNEKFSRNTLGIFFYFPSNELPDGRNEWSFKNHNWVLFRLEKKTSFSKIASS